MHYSSRISGSEAGLGGVTRDKGNPFRFHQQSNSLQKPARPIFKRNSAYVKGISSVAGRPGSQAGFEEGQKGRHILVDRYLC